MSNHNSQLNVNEQVDILLTEFQAMRAESSSLANSESTIITTTFSFIAAIIGLNFFFGSDFQEEYSSKLIQISTESSQCMILCICPLLLMFFGGLWINVLYRRIRVGTYLCLLENDINYYISEPYLRVCWEHWIIQQEVGRRFHNRTSRFYGYIVFGTWLLAPTLLFIFASSLFPQWRPLQYFSHHRGWVLFLTITLVIYLTIMVLFLKEILGLRARSTSSNHRMEQKS